MNTVPLWVTLLGFAAPLAALAGSAVAYVIKLFQDARVRRRAEFFELMGFIDKAGTIAQKVAAIYQLREFAEHKEFIVRFCQTQRNNVGGNDEVARQAVIDELDRTGKFFSAR